MGNVGECDGSLSLRVHDHAHLKTKVQLARLALGIVAVAALWAAGLHLEWAGLVSAQPMSSPSKLGVTAAASPEKMKSVEDERLARKRKWESARQNIQERLGALGLVVERDYRFHGEDWPLGMDAIGMELRHENMITADFLLACRLALLESEATHWGAVVGVRDSTRINGMRSVVEIDSGGFTAISGGEVTREVVLEAYDKLGVGHLLRPRQ